ncbi:MAG: ABC transporter ATP-binding protein [Candidatus Neomicrothrix subdominans]|jgi:branched-chain amino acid transport system ATP-binding protein|nr:ABC transporter ATP-binding protein [Candidatus Microthrix sp.]MBK6310656.1 ABC transporter ATP-binding protein [Candidatus Microthrix sp.]MBK9560819.1 ABC transporter ATP-binding protein [Candidatus Microthrix sp.]MBP9066823.1 ABC transporter ATP-binding protein [Candidatus Microthrix sp.]
MSLLEARNISVRFGGNLAVSEVDLDVDAGQIVGLIGPNGAGKTTTFNALTGMLTPTSGSVSLDGRNMTGWPTFRRAQHGLARTFQRLEVFTSLTVRENIQMAAELRSRDTAERVDEILELVGLTEIANDSASAISTGMARLLEVGRALATQPKVLLLDEPASGQDESETERFGEFLLELAAEGLAILMVEHDVPLVMRVCGQIVVLDFGQVIARGTPEEIQADEAVLDAYLGSATGEVG